MNGRKLLASEIARFILAGNATFTVVRPSRTRKVGEETVVDPSVRYTFKLQRAKGDAAERPWFAKVLTGSNNRYDFEFVGSLFPAPEGPRYQHSASKTRISDEAPSVRCLAWLFESLSRLGQAELRAAESKSELFPAAPEIQAEVDKATATLDRVEVWHEGKCGRCNIKLTVPESIESGFGPECAGKVGL